MYAPAMFIAIQQPRHGNNLMSTDRWMDKEDIYILFHGQRSPEGTVHWVAKSQTQP